MIGHWPALHGTGPVIGIDAGGTGTRAVLLVDGTVEGRFSSGPYNYLLHPDGAEQIADLIRASGARAAGVGVPGIARQPGAAPSLARQLSTVTGARVRVAPDATVAWLGAFLGAPGIVVIAGTGSVAVGGSGDSLIRVGGHGYLIGDQGGGYWIGRRAVRAALAAAEGSGPPTILTEAIPAATGCTLEELLARIYRHPRDRAILAGLAPVVARCGSGRDRDAVARDIEADAAAELARLARTLRRRLSARDAGGGAGGGGLARRDDLVDGDTRPSDTRHGAARDADLPVAGVGGVFSMPELWAEFSRRSGGRRPAAPPEVGAALLTVG